MVQGVTMREYAGNMATEGGNRHTLWAGVSILAILALSGYAAHRAGWFEFFCNQQCLLDFIDSLGPFGFVVFILLQSAQVVFAPIPGEVTGIIGGFLFGVPIGILLSTIGLTLGSMIAFLISRRLGRPFVERVVKKAILDKFDYLMYHKGRFLSFMLFLLPGFPKDYLCFILGLGRLGTWEFLAISGVGRLFGTTLLTLGGGYLRYGEYYKLGLLIVISAAFIAVAFFNRHKIERLLNSLLPR